MVRSRFRTRFARYLLLLTLLAAGRTAIAQPNDPETHLTQNEFDAQLRLAQVYEENRDWGNAVRVYELLYRQRPLQLEVADGYLRTLEALKRFGDAEKILTERLAAKSGVEQIEVYLTLARVQAKQNKKEDALRSFGLAEERSGEIRDCSALLPIAFGLTEVGYKTEALETLSRISGLSDVGSFCAGQTASLYLRLGEYGKAAAQYLKLVDAGEANLSMVQQRLAQFTQDSISRVEMLEAFRREVNLETSTLPSLQLLAWMYGETKDYDGAYQVIDRIDNINGQKNRTSGYDLLMFAERARAEGALAIAVKAYDEAIRRLKNSQGRQNQYFVDQAELGALRTKERFALSQVPIDSAMIRTVVGQYENYARSEKPKEYVIEASLQAASLSFQQLFDLERAKSNYSRVIEGQRVQTERTREAMFGLVDVALARREIPTALNHLRQIEVGLDKRGRPTDKEVRRRITYYRALTDFYQGHFDTVLAQLATITEDPSSDYANDAIALSNLIIESSTPASMGALKAYAEAQFAEISRDHTQALKLYELITATYPSSAIADDAIIRSADLLVKERRFAEAVGRLELVQEKMQTSPIADQAQFRMIEIIERELRDTPRAQRLYEDFLVRYPKSLHATEARERARILRGDVF